MLFEQLGVSYFTKKGLYSDKSGSWHPHQVHSCLNHVGMLISIKAKEFKTKSNFIFNKKGIATGRKDYKEYYMDEILPEIKKGNPMYTSCYTTGGHIVSVIGVFADGVLINDPYGTLLSEKSSYLVHGRDISSKLELVKKNMDLLEMRYKYNNDSYKSIEALVANKKGIIPQHLGEREEVKKYDIGITLNVLIKK